MDSVQGLSRLDPPKCCEQSLLFMSYWARIAKIFFVADFLCHSDEYELLGSGERFCWINWLCCNVCSSLHTCYTRFTKINNENQFLLCYCSQLEILCFLWLTNPRNSKMKLSHCVEMQLNVVDLSPKQSTAFIGINKANLSVWWSRDARMQGHLRWPQGSVLQIRHNEYEQEIDCIHVSLSP